MKQQNQKPKSIKVRIEISSNNLDLSHFRDMPEFNELHFLASPRWIIHFNRCHKPKIATGFVCGNHYHFSPLFDYNGEYDMTREEYNDFIQKAPIFFDELLGKIDRGKFTSQIIQKIRDYCKIKESEA